MYVCKKQSVCSKAHRVPLRNVSWEYFISISETPVWIMLNIFNVHHVLFPGPDMVWLWTFFAVHGEDFTMCAARPRLLTARHWRVVCGRGVTPLPTFNSFVMWWKAVVRQVPSVHSRRGAAVACVRASGKRVWISFFTWFLSFFLFSFLFFFFFRTVIQWLDGVGQV